MSNPRQKMAEMRARREERNKLIAYSSNIQAYVEGRISYKELLKLSGLNRLKANGLISLYVKTHTVEVIHSNKIKLFLDGSVSIDKLEEMTGLDKDNLYRIIKLYKSYGRKQ
jgi:hypothetical protein